MKSIGRMLFFGLLMFFTIVPISAQQTGEIRGVITEEKGEALIGVSVTATSPNLQGIRTAVSDKNGLFRLPLLPVGMYSLAFELSGFEKLTVVDQIVRLGFTVDIPVILKPAAMSAEITIKAPAPLIDKTKTDTSYRLSSVDLTFIPIQGRTITEVAGLTPGVTGVRVNMITGGSNFGPTPHAGYSEEMGTASFRGEGDLGNNWQIDGLPSKGAAANDPGVKVNYDAWDEVQIISDGFAPEMGQGMGGFIHIVTKSGGNRYHGELGALLRDRNLRAARQDQLSASSVPDTSLHHYFGNLGGPILRDRLWFFLSDNYHRSLDWTTERSIGWLTIPAGERRIGTNNLFGKITFTPFKNQTLALTGTMDNFLNQNGGIGVPAAYSKWIYDDNALRLNYHAILSPDTLLTLAGGLNRRSNSSQPLNGNYGPPAYYWLDVAQTTNNVQFAWSANDRRTDLAIALIRYLDLGRWGNHELKAGFSFYANEYAVTWLWPGRNFDPWPGNGFDQGATFNWASPGIPLLLTEFGPSQGRNSSRGFGFHLQDSLTLGRFSLMLGLRSDTQKVFDDRGELGWSWAFGDFLQPRASIAADLTGDAKNVLKFAYGRFSMPMAVQALQMVINKTFSNSFRNYAWIGPENPNSADLHRVENWGFVYEQSPTATPYQVDPDLKPNKMDKFLLEFDRRLGANWALKARGIYSFARNLMDDVSVYDPQSPMGFVYFYTNLDLKKRDYRAIEVELNGRISDRLNLNASYTWSQAKGTNSGNNFELYTWDGGWGDVYDSSFFGGNFIVPADDPNKEYYEGLFHGLGGSGIGDEGWYGYLPYSVDHMVKVLGTYFAPYGFVVSSNFEFLSGYHWEKKGWSDLGYFTLFPEGRGGRTTPAHLYVDLAVEKEISIGAGKTVALGLNIFNLLNSQRPVSFMKQDTELFGQVWARQMPRWVQIKAGIRF